MFDQLVRNLDFITRLAKSAGLCAVGVGVIVRSYERIEGIGSLYTLIFCIFFALFLLGIAVHTITGDRDQQIQ